MAQEGADQDVRRALDVVQSMIDISADRLEGLRTQCATSAELTQQEIRTLEGKLIKLYSRQLVTKAKLPEESLPSEMRHFPSLRQWLQVVGLSPESVHTVCQSVGSLEALQEKTDRELCGLLGARHAREEEARRLGRALHNLRKYTEILVRGEATEEPALYWDSWDRHQVLKGAGSGSPRPLASRAARCSVPSEDYHSSSGDGLGGSATTLATASSTSSIASLPQGSPLPLSPPATPPVFKSRGAGEKARFPTTPPPCKKHQTALQSAALLPDTYPLTKSKSHESQLGSNGAEQASGNGAGRAPRARLPTEPGPTTDYEHASSQLSSPVRSPPYSSGTLDSSDDSGYKSTLQVPRSPHTPTISRGMGHVIAHRFTKTFKMMTTCDYCDKQMFIGTGLKCKECKYKCHRDCEAKVPPSCGLPRQFVDEFKRTCGFSTQSPSLERSTASPSHCANLLASITRRERKRGHPQPSINIPPFSGPDSGSNTSSCNSSTPSSPAVALASHTPLATPKQQFHFPDVAPLSHGVTLETHPLPQQADTHQSNDSDRTLSGSTDSERTPVRVDSQDSQVSDGEAVDRAWPRQNSLSLREWDIPYDELRMGERIGTGRFGTVYRGNWHGDVAIKVLNMDYLDDEKNLEAFRLEVATFRKTRHENLVLFMGACMKLPRLAIVTSMCKGMTLYTHIHLRKDKFNVNKTTNIAQQISQGMGYLHARGIIHKDLKSKNIFLESGKVVIADFGLFSVTKLCYGNRKGNGLSIPPGWLCYMAPEIIRSLKAQQKHDEEELPFSKASDVYAFGTVWYELLCGEWPFKCQPPEAIIWQVGKGMKQPLANLQASRDVKDILMLCWSYRASDRPEFTPLLRALDKLPKKRLARSPSHPIHLSRSAESVF
ncbi:kinase suppressor of Ras 2 [Bacillus rossius redtenbacheri]|uniref:kinase suppressor of Ras 2 n=1 Tax=Bacillus rossius redtenbacheri TaxID=93214 RepID=UPI002FDE43D8